MGEVDHRCVEAVDGPIVGVEWPSVKAESIAARPPNKHHQDARVVRDQQLLQAHFFQPSYTHTAN